MPDRVLIPLAGIGTLVLTAEAYQAALAEGAKMSAASGASAAATGSSGEPLLNAGELAKVLRLPKSWVYEKARTGEWPCVRTGKHVRFHRSAVLEVLRTTAPQATGRA